MLIYTDPSISHFPAISALQFTASVAFFIREVGDLDPPLDCNDNEKF